MISGAEAHRIGRALESVAGWTRELVVVLNEEVRDSTDKIVGQYGGKVFREPWKGHIAQKNSALSKASSAWILGLDADEVVSPELRAEIERTLTNAGEAEHFAAFSFPRLCWYCGRWIRHGDWYPDRQVRLWQRGHACWAGIDPHDKLVVDGRIGLLRADLHHYSRESINAHLQKIIPFSDEFVRQQARSGGRPGLIGLAVRPLWRFIRAYFFRLGLLDGWPGYYIACHTAFATMVRYAKLREALEHCSPQASIPVQSETAPGPLAR
jgi:glycosyltransferase involved in cell wall biosynthesis